MPLHRSQSHKVKKTPGMPSNQDDVRFHERPASASDCHLMNTCRDCAGVRKTWFACLSKESRLQSLVTGSACISTNTNNNNNNNNNNNPDPSPHFEPAILEDIDWPASHYLPFVHIEGCMLVTCANCKFIHFLLFLLFLIFLLFLLLSMLFRGFLPLVGDGKSSVLCFRLQKFQLFFLSQLSCKFCLPFLSLRLRLCFGHCPCCLHFWVHLLKIHIFLIRA